GVAVDGDVAYVGDASGNVYAVALKPRAIADASRLQAWRRNVAGIVDSVPAVGGGRVDVVVRSTSSGKVQVVSLNAENGRPVWSYSAPPDSADGTPVTIAGSELALGLGNSSVVALSARDGSVIWTTRLRSPFLPLTGLASSKGYFLALASHQLSPESGLYRITAATGARSNTWHYGGGL